MLIRLHSISFTLAVIALVLFTHQLTAQPNEKQLIESTIQTFEHACESYDFDQANSLLTPDAQWIEDSYPEPAQFTAQSHWQNYKSAKLRINYHLRDFTTHINGDTAWSTLALDSTFTADNPAARALNENQKEWRGTFVETYVLVKLRGTWKIALGHTSLLPKK
jgi:hypothetical protein